MMSYQEHTVKDFLLDERFRKWVLEPDPETAAFWEAWLKDNPSKEEEVQQARDILQLIRFREDRPSEHEQAATWERIEQTLREENSIIHLPDARLSMPNASFPEGKASFPLGGASFSRTGDPFSGHSKSGKSGRNRSVRYAAALAALLVAVSLAFYLFSRIPVRHYTAYGEVKTIVLPDNSILKLNANSRVRYDRSWDSKLPREIWLEGEAFFSVVHKSNDQPFLVHTEDMTVKVTGTEFNVNTRHIATRVVLNNGSVRLLLNPPAPEPGNERPAAGRQSPGSAGTAPDGVSPGIEAQKGILMQPGDMVSWSSATGKLQTARVDPELYSSWRTNILLFRDTPILEVARSLRDNFGLSIRFEDRDILQETFTGSIPMDNVDVFFKTLSRTFNVEVIRKDKEIIIAER